MVAVPLWGGEYQSPVSASQFFTSVHCTLENSPAHEGELVTYVDH